MVLVKIAMSQQADDELVGLMQVGDLFAGKEWREAVLPRLVVAFDFSLGLRGWGVAEGYPVEAKGVAELGGAGMGEEDGVKVDVDFQWESVSKEGSGQQIQVGEQVFGSIDFGVEVQAGAIIQQVQEWEIA